MNETSETTQTSTATPPKSYLIPPATAAAIAVLLDQAEASRKESERLQQHAMAVIEEYCSTQGYVEGQLEYSPQSCTAEVV